MKKIFFLIVTVLLSSSLFAGFSGPRVNLQVSTANEVETFADDTQVLLEGYLVNQVDGETYTFKDSTGEVLVEIDHKDFRGQNVTPQDKVKLYGEVDKELMEKVKVDIDYLEIIK